MNSLANNRVRGTTWAFAALVLILFFWLGFAIAKFSTIFQGLEARLPVDTRIFAIYGPVGLPVLGGITAALILLVDLLRPRRYLPLQLTSVCVLVWMLLAMLAFRSFVYSVPLSTLSSSDVRPLKNGE